MYGRVFFKMFFARIASVRPQHDLWLRTVSHTEDFPSWDRFVYFPVDLGSIMLDSARQTEVERSLLDGNLSTLGSRYTDYLDPFGTSLECGFGTGSSWF